MRPTDELKQEKHTPPLLLFVEINILAPMEHVLYLHALDLFNRACFFDAHEVWEDVWRAAPPEEKKFLQGLIQIAVAFHHHSTGNIIGARSLLERGTRN